MIEKETMYNITEAANLLGVHKQTLRMWAKNGDIKYYRIGNGWYRFPESEIKRILEGE